MRGRSAAEAPLPASSSNHRQIPSKNLFYLRGREQMCVEYQSTALWFEEFQADLTSQTSADACRMKPSP
jgi:hypothetical protein